MTQAAYPPQNVVLQTGNGVNFLTWDIVSGATGYIVQRSLDGVTFTTIASPTTTNYLDSAVVLGVNYFYQVGANPEFSPVPLYTPSYPVSITPCPQGQINLGYIRYMAQLRADKLNSQYLTTDEWNANINQSTFELYDILVTKYGDNYFFAPPVQIVTNGGSSYPLPDGTNYSGAPACYKLSGVDANLTGAQPGINAGWVALNRFNWSDRNKYTFWPGQSGVFNNYFRPSYREMGNNLYVIPNNTGTQLQLWYVPTMTQMLKDTDMLSFSISGWSEYVIVDAAMKAAMKERDFEKVQALQAMKAVQIERIETTAANRDVDQPNTVSNTRATMGDCGFDSFGNGWGSGYGSGGLGM